MCLWISLYYSFFSYSHLPLFLFEKRKSKCPLYLHFSFFIIHQIKLIEMEFGLMMMWTIICMIFGLKWLLSSVNIWYYEKIKLGGDKKVVRLSLPPGDFGWPFIGTMWSFLRAFKSSNPDSFISSFISRSFLFLNHQFTSSTEFKNIIYLCY